MTGRTQYLRTAEPYRASRLETALDGSGRWSIRRMLLVSAVISAGLWAPIVYLTAKALGY